MTHAPDRSTAWAALAIVALGRATDALPDLDAAESLGFRGASLPKNLGLAYSQLGRSREVLAALHRAVAVAALQESLRLDPTAVRTRCNLANALAATGDPAGAIEQFEAVERQAPGTTPARDRADRLRRGR